jgi:hypothetical protein
MPFTELKILIRPDLVKDAPQAHALVSNYNSRQRQSLKHNLLKVLKDKSPVRSALRGHKAEGKYEALASITCCE